MRILLLSAYDAASHRYWREGLVKAFAEHQWTVLTLPARYFSWRLRGNSLSWAFGERETLSQPYDLLIATSMVDLSALKGMVPVLATTPTLVYFHENQFDYPLSGQQYSSVEPQMLNIYTALAADLIAFNSDYNRETFLSGAKQLLRKMPDAVPAGVDKQLCQRSRVVPVPIEPVPRKVNQRAHCGRPLALLWNHRWEYDKGPDRFCRAITTLLSRRQDFTLHVVGQQFRRQPEEMIALKQLLETEYPAVMGCWGYVEGLQQYQQLLQDADVVISTALHDFQGLAIMEAVSAGCIPVLPDRLCYRQWYGPEYRYPSFVDDAEREADVLAEHLSQLLDDPGRAIPDVSSLYWDKMKAAYSGLFQAALGACGGGE